MAILERVVDGGSDPFLPLPWLLAGAEAAHAAALCRVDGSSPTATSGALIDGAEVDPALDGLPVLLTALVPQGREGDVRAIFGGGDAERAGETVGVAAPLANPFEVADRASDTGPEHLYGLFLLDRWPETARPATLAPDRAASVVGGTVSIIGFDNGAMPARLSMGTRLVRSHLGMLQHDLPTTPGFGGAPIFNNFWEILGVNIGYSGDPGHGPFEEDRVYNWGLTIRGILEHARPILARPDPGLAARIRATRPAPTARQTEGEPSYQSVFLSYSHDDRVFARRLYNALAEAGVDVWYDEERLLPGDLFERAIRQGMERSQRCIVCLSRSYFDDHADPVTDRFTQAELDDAFRREKEDSTVERLFSFIVPVDLDGFVFEGHGGQRLSHLRKRTIADFREWRDEAAFVKKLESLLKALEAREG